MEPRATMPRVDWTILRRSSDNEGSEGTRAAAPLGHVPALTGARGVAIALVLLQHYFRFLSGGFIGVDLFFVLSGFLITTLLLEERHTTGGVDLRAFYLRRARRLLPALVALLFVVAALAVAPSSP